MRLRAALGAARTGPAREARITGHAAHGR
jgi:hypothetical protein